MKDENKNTIPENADKPSETPAMQPIPDQEMEGVSGGGLWDIISDYLKGAQNPIP